MLICTLIHCGAIFVPKSWFRKELLLFFHCTTFNISTFEVKVLCGSSCLLCLSTPPKNLDTGPKGI